MDGDRAGSVARESLGGNVAAARAHAGLSVAELARAAHLGRRRTRAIERGSVIATGVEVQALASACGVQVADLLPPGSTLRVVGPGAVPLDGDAALDALLREYVSMVLELRGATTLPPATLRHEDLTELAHALGDSPAAIEARLIQLIGTDAEGARGVRSAITPSRS